MDVAERAERWLRECGWEPVSKDGGWRVCGLDTTAPSPQGAGRVRSVRVEVRRDADGGEVAVTDKTRRVNNAGKTPEPIVRREIPWRDGRHARRDGATARESQRRASSYGRARGHS